jgi:hypothetical protein
LQPNNCRFDFILLAGKVEVLALLFHRAKVQSSVKSPGKIIISGDCTSQMQVTKLGPKLQPGSAASKAQANQKLDFVSENHLDILHIR